MKSLFIKIFVLLILFTILYNYSNSEKIYFNLDTGRQLTVNKIFCFALISTSSTLISHAYNQTNILRESVRYIQTSQCSLSLGYECLRNETLEKLISYIYQCLLDEKEISPKELIKIRDSATEKIHTDLFDYSFYYIPIVWKNENNSVNTIFGNIMPCITDNQAPSE